MNKSFKKLNEKSLFFQCKLNKCNSLKMNKNAVVEYKYIRSFQEVDIFGKLPAYPSPKPKLAMAST